MSDEFVPGDQAAFFRACLESLKDPFLACGLDDRILWMNAAAAAHYASRGGLSLLGKSLLDCHNGESCRQIGEIKGRFAAEPGLDEVLITEKPGRLIWMRALRGPDGALMGYYERYAIIAPPRQTSPS